MRLALGLEYDGARFHGWQTQPDGAGVQDALERALLEFTGASHATICAGRTDTGVHALDQVVHIDTSIDRPLRSWVRGLNRFLPAQVAVRWSREVSDNFHARYSATRRSYDYWLLSDPVRSPLAEARIGWVYRPLDLDAMSEAARLLVGEHDFTSFRAAECQAATPVRNLMELTISQRGRLLRIHATANAFLHHMIRNIVGTLVYVGAGRHPPQWAGAVLAARDRRVAAPTFSAAGLYLARVDYDAAFNLPIIDDAFSPWPDNAPASNSVA